MFCVRCVDMNFPDRHGAVVRHLTKFVLPAVFSSDIKILEAAIWQGVRLSTRSDASNGSRTGCSGTAVRNPNRQAGTLKHKLSAYQSAHNEHHWNGLPRPVGRQGDRVPIIYLLFDREIR